VSVDDTATPISEADASRASIVIYNAGASTVYIGSAEVSDTEGFPLAAGATFSADTITGAIYGICASGADTDLTVMEVK